MEPSKLDGKQIDGTKEKISTYRLKMLKIFKE